MNDLNPAAIQGSLQKVREELHLALAKLDQDMRTMRGMSCVVELQVNAVRNAAYEALAELRHMSIEIDRLTSAASTTPSPETRRATARSRSRGSRV